MRGLKRFIQLSPEKRPLLLKTVLIVGAVRIGLWLLPFGALQRLAERAGKKSGAPHPVQRLIWAVKAASRRIPGATCLTQALAAQVLLARSGHDSSIHFGVAKDDQRGFEAHAWLTAGGQILIGGSEADRYAALAAWKSESLNTP
jgi:Transglutaminase-like superfamily